VEGAAPTSLSVSITVLASVCWAVTFISLGEREDDEVVGRDDALLGLERRELLVAGEQGLVLDDDEEHARCRRRHELGFKASFSSLICNFTHTALLFFFAIPVLPEIRGGNRQQLSYSAKIVRAGRPASSLEFSFIAEATMRGLVFVAGLSLFGGLPAGSAAADDNQNLKAICTGATGGDADRAASACSDLIKVDGLSNTDKAGAFIFRAIAYMRQGKYDPAISDAGSAIDLSPNLAEAFEMRAVAYLKKGDAGRALADSDKAIALKPDADMFRLRGEAHYAKGEDDLAIADYTKTISLKPASFEAFYGRGNAYDKKGDKDSAITDYTRAIELKPAFAEALNNRANSYLSKGDADRALEGYEAALAINPDLAPAYNGLGNVYSQKGDGTRAIAEYSKAISLDPALFPAFTGRGRVYLAKHDYDRALADLTKALAINPNDSNAAQAFWQATDERTKQAHANSSSAASEAQDAPPQPASRQADKRPGPSYDPNDEFWKEQQEQHARENDWNLRQLQELNDRAAEEDREADRQRQLRDQEDEWAREQQERSQREYQQRQDEYYNKQNQD
jgi:tetratricopeptide (TPR) repeat protein